MGERGSRFLQAIPKRYAIQHSLTGLTDLADKKLENVQNTTRKMVYNDPRLNFDYESDEFNGNEKMMEERNEYNKKVRAKLDVVKLS